MAGSLNKVTLIGNLGRDPEIRSMQNGNEVAQLSIATTDSWKDRNTGERKDRTEWHRVVVFSPGLVGVIKNYLKKGARVYIEGALQTRKWTDKDGQERYTTEIVMQAYNSTLLMLDRKEGGQGGQGGGYGGGGYSQDSYGHSAPGGGDDIPNGIPSDIDDEIPF